jgi:hypothetical protein
MSEPVETSLTFVEMQSGLGTALTPALSQFWEREKVAGSSAHVMSTEKRAGN